MIMLYSAAMVQKGAHYMMMQAMWGGIGLLACIFMASIDYRRWKSKTLWRNLSVWAYTIAVALVVFVLLKGVVRNYSRRWLVYGPMSFQPSEAAKLGLILFIAWYAERYQRVMGTFSRGIVVPLALTGLMLAPIFVEPDRGTTILLGLLVCLMLVLGGARWWHLALPALCAGLFFVYSISHDSLRSDRVRAWLNPEKYATTIAYQQWQSILDRARWGGRFGPRKRAREDGIFAREPDRFYLLSRRRGAGFLRVAGGCDWVRGFCAVRNLHRLARGEFVRIFDRVGNHIFDRLAKFHQHGGRHEFDSEQGNGVALHELWRIEFAHDDDDGGIAVECGVASRNA
jgi:hypothetical protein